MILYIITESATKYREGNWHRQKLTLESTSGDICMMLHYKQVSLKVLRGLKPWAICHSGTSTPFEEYDIRRSPGYREVVLKTSLPQLGICGGHQLIGMMYGSTCGLMRKIRDDDADHNPRYHPGEYKEWGVYPVTVERQDPLWAGLGQTFRVQQFHRSELKRLGRDLVRLASSRDCQIQAFRHRSKRIYGVQFHPEEASEDFPAGFVILKNFFKLAARA